MVLPRKTRVERVIRYPARHLKEIDLSDVRRNLSISSVIQPVYNVDPKTAAVYRTYRHGVVVVGAAGNSPVASLQAVGEPCILDRAFITSTLAGRLDVFNSIPLSNPLSTMGVYNDKDGENPTVPTSLFRFAANGGVPVTGPDTSFRVLANITYTLDLGYVLVPINLSSVSGNAITLRLPAIGATTVMFVFEWREPKP